MTLLKKWERSQVVFSLFVENNFFNSKKYSKEKHSFVKFMYIRKCEISIFDSFYYSVTSHNKQKPYKFKNSLKKLILTKIGILLFCPFPCTEDTGNYLISCFQNEATYLRYFIAKYYFEQSNDISKSGNRQQSSYAQKLICIDYDT